MHALSVGLDLFFMRIYSGSSGRAAMIKYSSHHHHGCVSVIKLHDGCGLGFLESVRKIRTFSNVISVGSGLFFRRIYSGSSGRAAMIRYSLHHHHVWLCLCYGHDQV